MRYESFKFNPGFKINYTEEEGDHIFFTSDTHFNHANIIWFCNRPFTDVSEMNRTLIDNWNRVVGPDDTVFHLGDFAWGGAPQWKPILDRLNGHKILILGNHDMKNLTKSVADEYFDGVFYQLSVTIGGRKVYLNHYPFLTYGGIYRNKCDMVYQLFGHVHSGPNCLGEDARRLEYLLSSQYDVGADNNLYTPISWNRVSQIIDERVEKFLKTKN